MGAGGLGLLVAVAAFSFLAVQSSQDYLKLNVLRPWRVLILDMLTRL